MIIGNKSDRANSVVSDFDINSMLNKYNMIYSYKVSAKSGTRTIDNAFSDIVEQCYKAKSKEQKDGSPEMDDITTELQYISEKLTKLCERLNKMKASK